MKFKEILAEKNPKKLLGNPFRTGIQPPNNIYWQQAKSLEFAQLRLQPI